MFPSIISRARTLQVVASGASGSVNGSLHLVSIYVFRLVKDCMHDRLVVSSSICIAPSIWNS